MKRSSIFVLLAFSGASLLAAQKPAPAAPGSSQAQGPEKVAQQEPTRVVATVDGHPVTAKEAADLLDQLPASQRQRAGNLARVLDQIYILHHFSSKAEEANLQNQSPWKEDIAFTRERLLAQAYLQQLTAANSPRAKAAQDYYNQHANEFVQVQLSGILIGFAPPGTPSQPGKTARTEQQARAKVDAIEKKLKTGAKFETLARTESDNPESAPKGGDLGTIDLNSPNLPATIKTAVAALQPGELSEPVQVRGGFYIFKVRSRSQLPFSKVRAQIIMQQIYAQYKLEVKDAAFFNTATSNTPSLAHPEGSGTRSHPAPVPGTLAKPPAAH
ncbi:MAG TPA: peptidylprolyl isomerase [Bryobacteraceae bacterium]